MLLNATYVTNKWDQQYTLKPFSSAYTVLHYTTHVLLTAISSTCCYLSVVHIRTTCACLVGRDHQYLL